MVLTGINDVVERITFSSSTLSVTAPTCTVLISNLDANDSEVSQPKRF
jgi:hypothetical protein